MKEITVADILRICNGKLVIGKEETVCKDFCQDTRQIHQGDVYVGIKGENLDGSLLYDEALKQGASICLIEDIPISEEVVKKYPQATIIIVENTIVSIQKLAMYKREFYDIPIIAVTGSVGKTSTKDIIASVVSEKYNVLKTKGNYNNHIGLPLTLLGLKDHTAVVVEMGMNDFGEIRTLTNIAKPTICVITNIGTAHIGKLGSRENILKAKLEILEGMKKDGTLIINNDNDLLYKWNKNNKQYLVISFGIENPSDTQAININLQEFSSEFELPNKEKIKVPIAGIHFIYNALCAISVGKRLGISIEKIKKGIENFELSKNRMEKIETSSGITIISDCYNANYDSMKVALESLEKMTASRKIAVLGDMLELGKYSQELHEKVGIEVSKCHLDFLITVGKESKAIVKKVKELGMPEDKIYENHELSQAIKTLDKIVKSGDILLIKASNGMKFNKLVEFLKNK